MSDSKLEFESIDQLKEFVVQNPLEGVVIRTQEEEQQYWDNTVKEQISNRTKELYGSFEEHIAKVTGKERQDGEKAYDYFTRVWSDTTSSFDQTKKEYEKRLEEKISAADAGNEFKKRYETLQEKYKREKEELEGQLQEKDRAVFLTRVESSIDKDLERIEIELDPKFVPNDFIKKSVMQNLRDRFRGDTIPKQINGAVIFNDKEDKPLLNSKTGATLTSYEILKSMLPDEAFLKQVARGGTGGGAPEGGGEPNPDDLQLPDTVQTISQLIEYIKKTFPDIDKNSERFNEIYTANKGKVKFTL